MTLLGLLLKQDTNGKLRPLRFARFFLMVISLLVLISFLGYSAPTTSREFVINPPTAISLGVGTQSFKYQEYQYGPIMEMQGSLSTINISTRFPLGGNLFFQDYSFGRIGGSISRGQLTYEGETWGGDPLTAITKERLYRFKGSIGAAYTVDEAVLEPYGGLWVRSWADKLKDPGGYRRRITQFFLLGGASLRIDAGPYMVLGLGAEGYELSYGRVKSYLSDVDRGFNDPVVEQDQGYGLKGYVRSWINLFGLVVRIEGYGSYLDIEGSDFATLSYNGIEYTEVHEPDNTTIVYGVNLSLVWG